MRVPEFVGARSGITAPAASRMHMDRLMLKGHKDWRGTVIGLADEGLAFHRGVTHVAEKRVRNHTFWLDANLAMDDVFTRITKTLPAVGQLLDDPPLSRGAMRLRQLSADGAWNSEYLALNANPDNALKDSFKLQGELLQQIRDLATHLQSLT